MADISGTIIRRNRSVSQTSTRRLAWGNDSSGGLRRPDDEGVVTTQALAPSNKATTPTASRFLDMPSVISLLLCVGLSSNGSDLLTTCGNGLL